MGSSTGASGRGESTSPKQPTTTSPPRPDVPPDSTKHDAPPLKPDLPNAEAAKPLAPPPRPGPQGNSPDYFASSLAGSLSLEPNPFEQSFGGGAAPETPGGTKLPSVAALTSPSSLIPGSGVTPFPWGGGSLRTGPLSPAMLSGPANDYFSNNHHIRGGFPTPNESSLRTGLTPGGSGSMFPPAPSPSSQTLFGQAATPGTLDFHRTALAAATSAKQQSHAQQPPILSQPPPPEMTNGVAPLKQPEPPKAPTGPFDPHDNDAANGLFMLAQGRNGSQPQSHQHPPPPPPPQSHPHPPYQAAPAVQQPSNTSPRMAANASVAGSSARGMSELSNTGSEDSGTARPTARSKGKRNSTSAATTNGRRKADDAPSARAPSAKKTKTSGGAPSIDSMDMDDDGSEDDMKETKDEHGNTTKVKMTDEEKRKNFLERNRVAALKCRQRKKQWLANLQNKVELYSTENDSLVNQITALREEVVNLKTLLLAHKDCPVTTQQQGMHSAFMQQTIEPFSGQMNPYGMAAPIPNQAVMSGQSVNRRFS